MTRPATICVTALCVVLATAWSAVANPIPVMMPHDSPEGTPNGIWDDQWSGGTVFPSGEYFDDWPAYGVDCHLEDNASIAPIGDGDAALYCYQDPPQTGVAPSGYVSGVISLRQTCWEVSTVVVTLYKAGATGCPPCEELLSTSQTVACGAWPPTVYMFELGEMASTYMDNERFLIVISSPDAQCTDVVWDCETWPTFFEFPGVSAVEGRSWGTVKAMYR